MARWYETFLDVCKAAKRRNLAIVCNPSAKIPIQDMMERVYEDELWTLGDLPPLMVHPSVEPGTYQLAEQHTLKLVTMAAAMRSDRGLGRFDVLYSPDEALKRKGQ